MAPLDAHLLLDVVGVGGMHKQACDGRNEKACYARK